MNLFFLSFLLPIISISYVNSLAILGAHSHLVQATLVFRHGDRNPTSTYKNDIYKEADFPEGFGSLTNAGKIHSFKLGQLIKERYLKKMKLLPFKYDHKTTAFRSTDVRRSLETVQYMANGLFPPTDDQVWMEGVDWQAFPIHTVPVDDDQMLRPHDGYCRAYDAFMDEIRNSDSWLSRQKSEEDFLKKVSDHAGQQYNLWTISNLYSTLKIEKELDYELPDWANEEGVLDHLKELDNFKTQALFDITDDNYRTVSGGVFVNEVLENFNKLTEDNEKHTLKLYSAHDTTLTAIFTAFGIEVDTRPDYNAVLSFELYYDVETKEYLTHIFYKQGNDIDFKELQLKNCSRACNLEDFKRLLNPIAVADRTEACKL